MEAKWLSRAWIHWRLLSVILAFPFSGVALASPTSETTKTPDELWRTTLKHATAGDFTKAAETVDQIQGGGRLVEQVRTWLNEHEAKQVARRELNQFDFEKYVGYSKARIERKEYREALGWALSALDCAANREEFLASPWIQGLTNDALAAAEELKQQGDWKTVWQLYTQLALLFELEPRFQKLERQAATHLRLNTMFKEESNWKERIEHVRWSDAEDALKFLNEYYVAPADFKSVAEGGLEQMLLLAESKSAQEAMEGLRDEDDRRDFVARVKEHIEQVHEVPDLDWRECVQHFRRILDINKQTVKLSEELVVSELMRGGFEPLDEFTTIIWPSESDEFDKHTRGDFVGVGISIIKNRTNEIEVVTPLEDTPAYRAGIQAGDIISHVDDKSLKGFSINKVVDTITGPKDSHVTLTIVRDGKELKFPLQRAKVKIRSVKGLHRDSHDEERWEHWLDKERGIGYVRVTNFQRNTVEDVDNLVSELAAKGLKGLVVDVRDDPGGLLDTAWQLSSRFLRRGDTVVSTRGRIRSEDQVFQAQGDGAYPHVPLVVLVNERSASASEIVSGAVRDNGRGLVVGERTFGKFSVQNLIPLGRGGAKLKITTARYHLPKGASLHREPTSTTWGVEPDIPIPLVFKEKENIWKGWRDANLLGPAKAAAEAANSKEKAGVESDDDEAPLNPASESEMSEDAEGKAKAADGKEAEKGDDNEAKAEEAKLPQLEQPDENNRPKGDPQLDVAVLVLRMLLVGEASPTLATAELKSPDAPAQP